MHPQIYLHNIKKLEDVNTERICSQPALSMTVTDGVGPGIRMSFYMDNDEDGEAFAEELIKAGREMLARMNMRKCVQSVLAGEPSAA